MPSTTRDVSCLITKELNITVGYRVHLLTYLLTEEKMLRSRTLAGVEQPETVIKRLLDG